jgi:hypothetical protein
MVRRLQRGELTERKSAVWFVMLVQQHAPPHPNPLPRAERERKAQRCVGDWTGIVTDPASGLRPASPRTETRRWVGDSTGIVSDAASSLRPLLPLWARAGERGRARSPIPQALSDPASDLRPSQPSRERTGVRGRAPLPRSQASPDTASLLGLPHFAIGAKQRAALSAAPLQTGRALHTKRRTATSRSNAT